MQELFQKEGQSIFTFKPGDIIIRLKPMIRTKEVFNTNLGITMKVEASVSNDFREPMEFVAIENNRIYLRYKSRFMKSAIGDKAVSVPLEDYAEDWALFAIPPGLTMEDCL